MPPAAGRSRRPAAASVLPIVAFSSGESAVMSRAPAMPSATPSTPPTMPFDHRLAEHLADDAPALPAERLEGAELAHAPRDRGHGEQAGHRKAATSAAIASHLPRRVGQARGARQRAADLVGQVLRGGHRSLGHDVALISFLTAAMLLGAVGAHVDLVDLVGVVAELLGAGQRDVQVGRRLPLGSVDDADDLELGAADLLHVADRELVLLRVGLGRRERRWRWSRRS